MQESNYIGQKFGRLTVFERLGYRAWICICDCGEVVIRNAHAMNPTKTSSCGCYMTEFATNNWKKEAIKNRKPLGYAASKKTYSNKRREALRKGIIFEITFEQFVEIAKQNCYYCAATPRNCSKFKTFGDFTYNGMDKVDRKKGYIMPNVVPCCWNCNRAKATLSQEEFFQLITNIYHNRIKNGK